MTEPLPTLEYLQTQQTAHLDEEGDRAGDPTATDTETATS